MEEVAAHTLVPRVQKAQKLLHCLTLCLSQRGFCRQPSACPFSGEALLPPLYLNPVLPPLLGRGVEFLQEPYHDLNRGGIFPLLDLTQCAAADAKQAGKRTLRQFVPLSQLPQPPAKELFINHVDSTTFLDNSRKFDYASIRCPVA